jgi:hypothetical protein
MASRELPSPAKRQLLDDGSTCSAAYLEERKDDDLSCQRHQNTKVDDRSAPREYLWNQTQEYYDRFGQRKSFPDIMKTGPSVTVAPTEHDKTMPPDARLNYHVRQFHKTIEQLAKLDVVVYQTPDWYIRPDDRLQGCQPSGTRPRAFYTLKPDEPCL